MRYSELKQEKDIGLFAIKLDDGFLLTNDSEETIIFESKQLANDYIEENFLDGSEVVETSVEDISERELTDAESAKKERIVKKLKKHKGEFTDRYGDDGESVMYAVATKRAKMHEDAEDLTEDDVLGLRGLVAPGAPGGHTRGTGAYFGGVKPQKKTIQRKTAELKDRIRSTLGTHKGFKEDMDLDEGVDHDMKWLRGEYKKIDTHPTMTASEKSDAYKKAHRKHSIWNTKGSRNVSKHMGGMRVEEVELDEQKGKRYSVFGHYGNADKSGARPEVKHFVFGDSPEHAKALAQKHLSKKFKDYKVHRVQEGFEGVELEEGESYDNHYYVVGTIKNKHKAVLSGPHDFSDEQLRQHFQTKGDRYYRRYHGLSRISAMKGKDLVDRGYTRTYKKYMSEGMMEIEEDRDYTIVGSHEVDGKRKTVTHTVRGISALDAARTAKREHGAKLKDYKVHQWDDDVDESDIPFLDDILAEEIDLEESAGLKSFRIRGTYEDKDGNRASITHLVKHARHGDHAKDIAHLKLHNKYKNYKAESASLIGDSNKTAILGDVVREETEIDEGRQVSFKDLKVNDVFTHNGEKLKVQSKHIKERNDHLSIWASKASGEGFKHTDGDYKYKNTLVKKHQNDQVTVHEEVEVLDEEKMIKFKDLRPGDVFTHTEPSGKPYYHPVHGVQKHTVTYSMPTHKGYHRVDVKGSRDSHIKHGSTPVILHESHNDLNESHMSEIHAEIPKVYKNNELVYVEKGKNDEKFAVVKSSLGKVNYFHVLRYHPAHGWNRLSGTTPHLNHAKQRIIANINGGDLKEENVIYHFPLLNVTQSKVLAAQERKEFKRRVSQALSSAAAKRKKAAVKEEVELDEGTPDRGGLFALVDKVSKKIVAKGSKAEMLKKKAGLTGQYILAYTYRVIGQPFSGQPVSEDFEIDTDMQLENINEDWAKKLAAENRAKAKEDRAAAKAEAASKAKTVKAETKAKAAFNPIKAHHLYAAIGDTYPDAEPFEALHLKFKHLGPEKVNQYANKAARAEGHKSFEHMVKSFHKQYKSDMGLHEDRAKQYKSDMEHLSELDMSTIRSYIKKKTQDTNLSSKDKNVDRAFKRVSANHHEMTLKSHGKKEIYKKYAGMKDAGREKIGHANSTATSALNAVDKLEGDVGNTGAQNLRRKIYAKLHKKSDEIAKRHGLSEGRKGATPKPVSGTLDDAVKHLSDANRWISSDKNTAHVAVTKAHLILKRHGHDHTKEVKAIHDSMLTGDHQTAIRHIVGLRSIAAAVAKHK